MIVYIIILILSFLLDGFGPIHNNITLTNLSIFSTMYSIIAISIISPYIENNKRYFIILFILGSLIDIAYTNTFLLNAILFILIGIITKSLYKRFSNGPFIPIIISLISIIIYNVMTYLILVICNYIGSSINTLINVITHNIISTILYSTIITFILIKLDKKYKLKIIK